MTPLAPSPDTKQNLVFTKPFDLRIAKCNKIYLRCYMLRHHVVSNISCAKYSMNVVHCSGYNIF